MLQLVPKLLKVVAPGFLFQVLHHVLFPWVEWKGREKYKPGMVHVGWDGGHD